jgi:hypothetical protein
MRPQPAAPPDVPAGELGDQQGRRPGVHGEHPIVAPRVDRAQASTEPVPIGGQEGVGQPAAGVVDEDLDGAERRFGAVEQQRRHGGVGEVGLHGLRGAAGLADLSGDLFRGGGAHLAVLGGVRFAGVPFRIQAEVGQQDRHAFGGKRPRGRRPDALVGPGHQGHPAVQTRVEHSLLLTGAGPPAPGRGAARWW